MPRTKQKDAEARVFLRRYLKRGRKPRNEVIEAAARAGINRHTLEKASREIGITKRKGTHPEFGQCSYWRIEAASDARPAGARPSRDRLLEAYSKGYAACAKDAMHAVRSALSAIAMDDENRKLLMNRVFNAIERECKSTQYRVDLVEKS
ncbi:hypothetical protein [Paraburkholderia mimosarum]|uniref:hypothetical protein n=1 Tax=Paraburkholderia mimosarum TaxID=312026 RepID=UPI0004820A5B|nr:hypothetical protein [Paraburkholderia mimosarum]